jgi:thioredoxin 1
MPEVQVAWFMKLKLSQHNMKDIVEVSECNFDAQVLNAASPVLVDFWAPWCGPCKMQLPILEAVAGRMSGQVVVAKVNVDDASNLAGRYGITSIPTLLLFKDGKVARQFVGLQMESALVAALEATK